MALTQSGSCRSSLTPQTLRHLHVERLAGHGQGHLQPAGADGQHAQRAGRRRVAVRAQQGLARLAEALHVHGVADAVARAAEPDAEPLAGALQEEVVVGILDIRLDQVVVDVLGRDLGLHAVQAHRFQLQHHQRAGGVLGQGLVDADADFLARASFHPRPDGFGSIYVSVHSHC